MIFLEIPDPHGTTFKVLLIASEIIIPLIVFIGAYYFFKPVMEKQAKEQEQADAAKEDSNEEASSS